MNYTGPNGEEINLRKVSDADYAKAERLSPDPLDVCPTCGGHKEYIVPGYKEFVPRTYKFDGVEHKCNCSLQRALRVRYLLAGIGNEFWPLDWERDYDGDEEADKVVRNYVDNWEAFTREGMGIMFSSPTQGVGKTWGAVHIGKEMIKRRQRVFFINFPTMVGAIAKDDKDTEDRMRESRFLILDDIQAGISDLQTNLYAMAFESIIRQRMMFNLPTITTTNLTKPEFEVHFSRIGSLLDAKQIWVDVEGTDYRRSEAVAETRMWRILNKEIAPIV